MKKSMSILGLALLGADIAVATPAFAADEPLKLTEAEQTEMKKSFEVARCTLKAVIEKAQGSNGDFEKVGADLEFLKNTEEKCFGAADYTLSQAEQFTQNLTQKYGSAEKAREVIQNTFSVDTLRALMTP